MVYTKSIKRLHLEYLTVHPSIDCSRSTIVNYRQFYIEVPTEIEKQSCLCIVCQKAHTKLRGIKTFRKLEKLQPMYSVTKYLKSQQADYADHASYPERSS